jgi:hypothetical protein
MASSNDLSRKGDFLEPCQAIAGESLERVCRPMLGSNQVAEKAFLLVGAPVGFHGGGTRRGLKRSQAPASQASVSLQTKLVLANSTSDEGKDRQVQHCQI